MPEEFTLTKWLDAVSEYPAKQAGVTAEDYSIRVGSEGIATGIEVPIDLFLTTLGAKIVKAGAGLISLIYATWGKPPSKRLQSELFEMGSHWTFEVLDPKLRDILELTKDVGTLAEAARRRDPGMALRAFTRTPEELRAATAALTGAKPLGAELRLGSPEVTVKVGSPRAEERPMGAGEIRVKYG